MSRLTIQECRDLLEPGERTLQAEVHRDGTMTILCPCCEGCGEHDTHSGNDPGNCAHPCGSCGGTGTLNDLPELRTETRPGRDVRWTGWNSPSGAVRVRPVTAREGGWRISGPAAGRGAETDAGELVQMARAITRNLENRGSTERLDWIRDYRRLVHRADLQEAREAWERSHPGMERAPA